MKKRRGRLVRVFILLVLSLVLFSCGKGEKEGSGEEKQTTSVLAEKQKEIASDIVKEIKTPIDMAKEAAEREKNRIEAEEKQATY